MSFAARCSSRPPKWSRRFVSALLLTVAPGALLYAQPASGDAGPTPGSVLHARPALATGADTNDAASYLAFGRSVVERQPKVAAAAGYWATRLDPTSPAALLMYMDAEWRTRSKLLGKVLRGDRAALRSPDVRRLDSLRRRAVSLDPFAIGTFMAQEFGSPSLPMAQRALARDSNVVGIHLHIANRFYDVRAFDSSAAYLRSALRALDRRATTDVIRPYESRELVHFALGRVLYAAGDVNAARLAFGQALTEDLSFAPAHAQLGTIAWTNWSDTAAARREFELSLELADDAVVRYDYGTILLTARADQEALQQLDRAAALEPWFARVHYNRAVALERLGQPEAARAAYQLFIARAPRRLESTIALAVAHQGRLAVALRAAAASRDTTP